MKNRVLKLFIFIVALILSIDNLFSNDRDFYADKNNNIIHLIGENHYDEDCLKTKEQLFKEAVSQKIILAIEGDSFGKLSFEALSPKFKEVPPNIFGIEDNYTHALVFTLMHYRNILLYKIIRDISGGEGNVFAPGVELYKKVFYAFFSPPDRILNDISKTIDSLYTSIRDEKYALYEKHSKIFTKIHELEILPLDADEEKVRKEKIAGLIENHSFEDTFFLRIEPNITQWLNFYSDIIDFCCDKTIQHNEQTILSSINEIRVLAKKFEEYTHIDVITIDTMLSAITEIFQSYELINDIKLPMRNQIFLKNIISIYEDNKLQDKPFFAIIGTNHVSFVYEGLKARGYEVEINDWGQEAYNQYLEEKETRVLDEAVPEL